MPIEQADRMRQEVRMLSSDLFRFRVGVDAAAPERDPLATLERLRGKDADPSQRRLADFALGKSTEWSRITAPLPGMWPLMPTSPRVSRPLHDGHVRIPAPSLQ